MSVVACVTPEDKVKLLTAVKERGEIVAMTGDGVNDAPSLKKADIGIAVGSGTDVSKEVADLILLDNSFKTITVAIEEGRRIIINIRKVIIYLLSDSLDVVFLIGGSLLLGFPLPLNALQILWVNFFSDSFPSVAFAFEELDGPGKRPEKGRVFDKEVKLLILGIGVVTSALLIFVYWWVMRIGVDPALARTFIFATFGVYTLFVAFPLRSLKKGLFTFNPFSNLYLVGGVLFGLVMMFSALYIPFLQELFDIVSLPLMWWTPVIGIIIINIALIEGVKWVFGHQKKK